MGQGDDIAEVGGDPGDQGRGTSDGAHLHFWITKGNWRIRPDGLIDWFDEVETVDIQRLTDALNRLWEVKSRLEAKRPLNRKNRDDDAKVILDVVIAVKEECSIP